MIDLLVFPQPRGGVCMSWGCGRVPGGGEGWEMEGASIGCQRITLAETGASCYNFQL